MKEAIYDELHRCIGYVDKIGNETLIFDNLGKLLGKHNGLTNYVTTDLGKIVGKGIELLGSLLK